MRRHLLLLALIVAIVVAIALLRPQRVVQGREFAPAAPPSIESGVAAVPPIEDDHLQEPAPPLATPNSKVPAKPVAAPGPVVRKTRITVVDADGQPVVDAVVLILKHSYSRPSGESKVEERRTGEAGQFEFTMGAHDSAHVFSFKVGVGAGVSGAITSQTDVTLKYEKHMTLRIKCAGVHEVPLEGAGVVLTTEVLFGERRDAFGNPFPLVISLPPRMLLTDREGACAFGGVLPPMKGKTGWNATPGVRHRIKAGWHTLSALAVIENAPDGIVPLFLQQ